MIDNKDFFWLLVLKTNSIQAVRLSREVFEIKSAFVIHLKITSFNAQAKTYFCMAVPVGSYKQRINKSRKYFKFEHTKKRKSFLLWGLQSSGLKSFTYCVRSRHSSVSTCKRGEATLVISFLKNQWGKLQYKKIQKPSGIAFNNFSSLSIWYQPHMPMFRSQRREKCLVIQSLFITWRIVHLLLQV